jgi:hypothetical protein
MCHEEFARQSNFLGEEFNKLLTMAAVSRLVEPLLLIYVSV